MKIALIICVAVILTVACSRAGDSQLVTISDKDLLIDVRTAGEYNGGHLKNALNIPYDEIADRIGKRAKDKSERIVVYCRSGHRATIAKKTLEKMGYTNVVNAGGYRKLKAQQTKLAKAQDTTAP